MSNKTTVSFAYQRPSPEQGFTLVEVMVVVVILSVMAGLVSLSVNGGKARKNRAFYEHIIDSMDYIRLLSAERMQPMGISLVSDESGKIVPKVLKLENAYAAYSYSQQTASVNNQDRSKNSMELSSNIRTGSNTSDSDMPTPAWVEEVEVNLPATPEGVTISFIQLEQENSQSSRELQPWFVGQNVPSLLWYGTGQATAVNIEIKYNERLVGEVIQLLPDGSVMITDDVTNEGVSR